MADRIGDLDSPKKPPKAAKAVLRARMKAVIRLAESAATKRKPGAQAAHAVRVATRRAETALAILGDRLEARPARNARRELGRLRRAAGGARECDVLLALLDESEGVEAGAAEHLRLRIEGRHRAARRTLRRAAGRFADGRGRRAARRLIRSINGRNAPSNLVRLARQTIPGLARRVREATEGDLGDRRRLHELRLSLKELRYALEILEPAIVTSTHPSAHKRLALLQDISGDVGDLDAAAAFVRGEAARLEPGGATGDLRAGLERLAERLEQRRDARQREAIEALVGPGARDLFGVLADASPGSSSVVESKPHSVPDRAPDGPVRLAAMDVGTNSIRLLVAEVHPDGTYRVLDDEREPIRLGRGLGASGMLEPMGIDRAADALARMARIAEGYGVHATRAIGTSACREAANTDELVRLTRERAGIDLEVISAEEEARLAFLSASHSFDLRTQPGAVIDIGGGSTEVILSTGGVIQTVYTLPLGAVRMTEQFGGPGPASGERFGAMRKFIRRTIRANIGDPPLTPQVAIGSGGTFTTLAGILIRRGSGGPSLFDRGVGGYETTRSDVRHVLDHLRALPIAERAHVPGLAAERADIFVAGLTIAERLLKHLGINVLRVHERGVRDGLILSMAGSCFPGLSGIDRRNPMRAVRRFAEACRYEQAHSEHVTRLALSLFDQLARQAGGREPWSGPAGRRLLEAAAVLHDVGYLVNYSRHHKHSYHLIIHSDIAGFTAREIAIIANVARYHRRAEPRSRHDGFAALARDDRELVRRLAAILRLADGLDRTHTQSTRAVTVRNREGVAGIIVEATGDAATDIWGAERKNGLFKKTFGVDARFTHRPTEPPPDERETGSEAAGRNGLTAVGA